MITKKKDLKILVLGSGQSNFLDQLYGDVKNYKPDYKLYIDKYKTQGLKNQSKEQVIYNKQLDLNNLSISKSQLFVSLVSFFFSRLGQSVFWFELYNLTNVKQFKTKLLSFIKAKCIYNKYIKNLNIDIYHFHFCVSKNLVFSHFIPKNKKIIISYWGSDLMRNFSKENNFYVEKALKKATAITMQSPEMGQIFSEKHSKIETSKLKFLRFTLNKDIYNSIDTYKNDTELLKQFKEQYYKNQNKTIIALGHNAFMENNHFKMIETVKELPKHIKEHILFLLHLSYGGTKEYIKTLLKKVEQEKDLNFVVIKDYLGPENMAKLRLTTDILIQAPTTDALSGAMTEVLYAGNKVIAGSWLPYQILKRNNIEFEEIEKFEYLPKAISQQLITLSHPLENKKAIKSFLFPDTTTKDWINLFEEVCNE